MTGCHEGATRVMKVMLGEYVTVTPCRTPFVLLSIYSMRATITRRLQINSQQLRVSKHALYVCCLSIVELDAWNVEFEHQSYIIKCYLSSVVTADASPKAQSFSDLHEWRYCEFVLSLRADDYMHCSIVGASVADWADAMQSIDGGCIASQI
eukprot:scaffold235419_cov18-Prasinocladus_malaysianus.AAC.1